MRLQKTIFCLCACLTLTLAACSGIPDRQAMVIKSAEQSGFTREIIPGEIFSLTTFRKQTNQDIALLVIYVEGDGFAFQRKGLLSPDPTPHSMITLALAEKDPHPSVMYIARPCQYLTDDALKTCDPKYWSTHRYSEDVIASIDSAINHAASGYKSIALIGYSGGGAVAVLIAARRTDVAWLVTIAANLDHKFWTHLHQITPLSGSLNAADFAESTQHLRQLHLVGERDKVVPFEVTKAFLSRMTNHSRVTVKTVPAFDHECCWVRDWPELACMVNGDASYCVK
jgi:hypothetical protein